MQAGIGVPAAAAVGGRPSGFVSAFVDWAVSFAHAHATLAYLLGLLLAGAESLPVVGALVPGTATIVAFGTLIAAGALDFWPFAAAVALGATLGDGFAYWLGHRYQNELLRRWPLSRHPEFVERGEALFSKHGGKSILFARFTPGVRAVIPVLAGILRMEPIRFYVINVLSAIVWALAHVLFGVLLGAGLELLGAVAGRLVALAGLLLVLVYIVIWLSRWSVRRLPCLVSILEGHLRRWVAQSPGRLARHIGTLLDADRPQAIGLGITAAVLAAGLWMLLGVLQDMISGDPLVRANRVVLHALAALRSSWGDPLMLVLGVPGSWIVLSFIAGLVLVWLLLRRDWQPAIAWVLGLLAAGLFTIALSLIPNHAIPGMPAAIGPALGTSGVVSAAAYGMLALFIMRSLAVRWRPVAISGFGLLLILAAFARLYLGHSLLSEELIGLAFGLVWVGFVGMVQVARRTSPVRAAPLVAILFVVLCGGMAGQETGYNLVQAPHPITSPAPRQIALSRWLAGGWDTLPARRVGLLGGYARPFSLQWAGSPATLARLLEGAGWRRPIPWTPRSTLQWLAPRIDPAALPVLPHLANGHPEALVLIRVGMAGGGPYRLVLRLWRSDVAIDDGGHVLPLWTGTVSKERLARVLAIITVAKTGAATNDGLRALAAALPAAQEVHEGPLPIANGGNGSVILAWAPPAQAVHP